MAARVILEMDVHSTDRAKKIRKAIQSYLGVDKVSVSPQTGLVVITGPAAADAEMLKRLIQYKLRKPVSIAVARRRWLGGKPLAGGAAVRPAVRWPGDAASLRRAATELPVRRKPLDATSRARVLRRAVAPRRRGGSRVVLLYPVTTFWPSETAGGVHTRARMHNE
ncbi:hypothetical protein ACQ4PT_034870 [Festuca glaucescens]